MKHTAIITGINGFIGAALNKRLMDMGWKTYPVLRPDVEYVFLFGSPSSNHWFDYALGYSLRETIDNFISAAEYCREHKIKLIYPSSGTVYEGKTPYAKCKHILDMIASIYDNTLGLRIFAGYGPGESHKQEYASIVYKFCKVMKRGERPVIWGDGTQTRDFIYIDDIVDATIKYRDVSGFMDIGTGVSRSFNDVVKIINEKLALNVKPIYKNKPDFYIEHTRCVTPYKYRVTLEEGIQSILYGV